MSFIVRPYRAKTDEPFVLGAWVASNRFAPGFREMSRAVYEHEMKRWVWRQLERHRIVVAHAEEDENALVGFAAWRIPDWDGYVLSYVYVKRPARRLGIARLLLAAQLQEGVAVVYTHLPVVRGLRVPEKWKYNQFLRGA
jgi:GNAT superfamily N-acetyltransferase